MPKELSSLKPYSYQEVHRSHFVTYQFVTDKSIAYQVYFQSGDGYFPEYPDFNQDIVTFGFGPENPAPKGTLFLKSAIPQKIVRFDNRIRDTLFTILLDSFTAFPQRSVFIMCDMHDGRQLCRNTLFNKWFSDFERIVAGRISKYNTEIPGPDGDAALLMLLVPDTCLLREKVIDAFLCLNDDLISKGY
jgi:hypothetical protein